jgi:hypothetical protein
MGRINDWLGVAGLLEFVLITLVHINNKMDLK